MRDQLSLAWNTAIRAPKWPTCTTRSWPLLLRGLIFPNELDARGRLLAELRPDPAESFFGDVTQKIIIFFQEQHDLDPHGIVDEPTAAALNQLATPQAHIVSGTVRREGGLPLPGLLVRAFHEDVTAAIRLGEDRTDGGGRYTIRYEPLPGGAAVNLSVSAAGNNVSSRAINDNNRRYR